MKNILKNLLKIFLELQNQRFPWLLMGMVPLALNIFSYLVFQRKLGLLQCELCVYIRFSMFCIFLGGVICAVKPSNYAFRTVFGYLLAGYGVFQGAAWNAALDKVYRVLDRLNTGGDFFALGGGLRNCSMIPSFPLGIPLDRWFPSWFEPSAMCGAADWHLFGFNMPQCLYLFYIIYIAAFILMILSVIFKRHLAGD